MNYELSQERCGQRNHPPRNTSSLDLYTITSRALTTISSLLFSPNEKSPKYVLHHRLMNDYELCDIAILYRTRGESFASQ